MRTLAKSLVARSYAAGGGLRRQHAQRLIVLTFHRICAPDARPPPAMQTLVVDGGDFRSLLRWMCARYEPFALPDWLTAQSLPERGAFAVTFDDGWADNYHYAWPILRELAIPATIFLSTRIIDNREPFWWQSPGLSDADIEQLKTNPAAQEARLAACPPAEKQQMAAEFLMWPQVNEMAQSGQITMGVHGHRHALLDHLPRADALADIRQGWEVLKARAPTGHVPLLAWPNGNARTDLDDELAALGLRAAWGTQRGTSALGRGGTWNLPRNNVDRHTASRPGLWPWLLLRANR